MLLHVHLHLHTHAYIYIYIQREREREGERETCCMVRDAPLISFPVPALAPGAEECRNLIVLRKISIIV